MVVLPRMLHCRRRSRRRATLQKDEHALQEYGAARTQEAGAHMDPVPALDQRAPLLGTIMTSDGNSPSSADAVLPSRTLNRPVRPCVPASTRSVSACAA